jgi:hypothetical protein
MSRDDAYSHAALEAERVVREHNVTALKVDPIALANKLGIEVIAKPASSGGVSGMLIRFGNQFGIAYATHIDNPGFRRFSIAHELGHYFLPGISMPFSRTVIFMSRAQALIPRTNSRSRRITLPPGF